MVTSCLQAFSWALDSALQAQCDFLHRVRPHPPAISNAIRYLRSSIARVGSAAPADQAKEAIISSAQAYISERVRVAHLLPSSVTLLQSAPAADAEGSSCSAVVVSSSSSPSQPRLRLWPGATVMTYGRSAGVEAVLLAAHSAFTDAALSSSSAADSDESSNSSSSPPLPGRAWPRHSTIRVIVVDSRPHLEGQASARALTSAGVPVTYVNLSSAAHVLASVDVLLLGAASVLGDGSVLGRAGAAMLASVAKADGKPVAVVAESFKLSDRTVTSSVAVNELLPTSDVTHPLPHAARRRAAPQALVNAAAAAAAANSNSGNNSSTGKPAQLQQSHPKGPKPAPQLQVATKGKAPPPAVVPWISSGVGSDAVLPPLAASSSSAPAAAVPSSVSSSSSSAGPLTSGLPSSVSALSGWRDSLKGLRVLGLAYDVTPSALIDVIVTEVGCLHPSTDVPLVTAEFGRMEELPQEEEGEEENAAAAGAEGEDGEGGDEEDEE